MDEDSYQFLRQRLLSDPDAIEALEQEYTGFLLEVLEEAAPSIYQAFEQSFELKPFWTNYPPRQRGRAPREDSIPWSEVGEKAVGANVIRVLSLKDPGITYPGLPLGGDIRFATDKALVHFDIKLTGPRDNPDEVVASPNQISGDGFHWQDGVLNSTVAVKGSRASMEFYPRLPPFYFLDGRQLLCLTYFLKGIYKVEEGGYQPLHHLELICVPNGLLLYDGPRYAERTGLFIPGKDDKDKASTEKRARVRLDPLASLGQWRCTRVTYEGTVLQRTRRLDASAIIDQPRLHD